ncbi:RpiB/LacA/LacB family sugar-phosphate isomerase [Consotaella salsifontis]|uniref:Ribose 5-phosphate isomerase B n=1 Tax=Consotaella salsifontis TaxID=1365950 RepID=A0A1T4TEC2_9HYPH|nr:RpiB/LacA/LacB family sugar-phosphate isomerase [Consotaella salsifontis]SKA38845.1 ribose 5-phosphate isomerase B [Consotaella salsifontis]
MKVILAGDSAGQPLVKVIAEHLNKRHDISFVDDSPSPEQQDELYANTAERAAHAILEGRFDRGILCCGTGIGVSISANKVPGIRAALAHDTYSAERAAKSNNAQIITMGARVIGPELAKAIVDAFLASSFDPMSHSAANVRAIDALDQKY